MLQKDLFESNGGGQIKTQNGTSQTSNFLSRYHLTLRIDQILVVSICLLVSFALIYALGFEKGKSIALKSKPKAVSVEEILSPVSSSAETKPVPDSAVAEAILPGSVQEKTPTISTEASNSQELVTGKTSLAENEPKTSDAVSDAAAKYTIQIVTFKERNVAQKEIERLMKKGLKGFIIPKGQFLHVCVNRFISHKEALGFLSDIKQKGIAPQDAYVRNIPRLGPA